jgi:hypothetical protein
VTTTFGGFMKYCRKKYSKENIEILVKESTSVRQILIKLELKEAGGNYSLIKRKIKEFGLNTSHFCSKG